MYRVEIYALPMLVYLFFPVRGGWQVKEYTRKFLIVLLFVHDHYVAVRS